METMRKLLLLTVLCAAPAWAAFPLVNPQSQFFDASGSPLSGGTIEFRNPTTDVLIDTYPTADDADAGTNANSNPLTLNSRGEAANGIYLTEGTIYKIILKDENGATVWTQDDVKTPNFYAPGDVRQYALNADGATDDAATLETIFNAHDRVIFPEAKTYAIESTITIPAGVYVDFGGSTIRKTTDDATDGYQIEVGVGSIIKNLIFELPTGVDIERAISLSADTQAINVTMTSVDQINNLGSTERAALNAEGDNIVIDGLYAENFDRPIRIENGSYGYFNNIHVKSVVTGLALDTYEYFTLSNFLSEVESANATSASGHSGMTLTNPQHAIVSDININDPSEHGIYLSVGPDDNHENIAFNNINVTRPGNTCLKMAGATAADGGARIQHVQVNGLRCIDAHFGSTAGPGEDGLRIEQGDYVTVSGFSVSLDQNVSISAYHGIYLRDSTNILIDGPLISNASYPIFLTDEGIAETLQNITIRGAAIYSGVDSVTIDADTASTMLRNIVIEDFYATAPSGYALNLDMLTAGIDQPIRISGTVRSATTGMYNNGVTGSATNLLTVNLKDAESSEAATGTYTMSAYGTHAVINSTAGAVTATLPDGNIVGQCKTITMSNAANSSTVSITSHETSSPEVGTFDSTSDLLVECWTGSLWYTAKNIGVVF